MVRRLQQPPGSENVDAFLLGASHGQLRSQFGVAFAHIEEPPSSMRSFGRRTGSKITRCKFACTTSRAARGGAIVS